MTLPENNSESRENLLREFRARLNRFFEQNFPEYLGSIRSSGNLRRTILFLRTGKVDIPNSLRQRIFFDQDRKAIRIGELLLQPNKITSQPAAWPEGDTEVNIEFDVLNHPTFIGPVVTINKYRSFEDNLLEIISASQMPVISRVESINIESLGEYRIIPPRLGEFTEEVYDGEKDED